MVETLANLVFIVLLVYVARSRRNLCSWDSKLARRRLVWGIVIVAVVQIGGFIKLVTMGTGIGVFGAIQWIGVYWVAAAIFRRRDLHISGQKINIEATQDKATTSQVQVSPRQKKSQVRLYILLAVAAWTSLVVLVGLAEPFHVYCCVGDWSFDLLDKLNELGGMFMFSLAFPAILFGAILFWWYGKT